MALLLLAFGCARVVSQKDERREVLPMRYAVTAPDETKEISVVAFRELKQSCPAIELQPPQERIVRLFNEVVRASNIQADWAAPVVLKCKQVNALSFTAIRQVIVFQGMLDFGLSDDELRFVLAHEVCHHLAPPKEVLEQEKEMYRITATMIEALHANLEQAMKELSASDKQLAKKRAADTVQIWLAQNAAQTQRSIEREVDLAALKIIHSLGISVSAAKRTLTKLSMLEKNTPKPTFDKIQDSWKRRVLQSALPYLSSHPPASERLHYIDWGATVMGLDH